MKLSGFGSKAKKLAQLAFVRECCERIFVGGMVLVDIDMERKGVTTGIEHGMKLDGLD